MQQLIMRNSQKNFHEEVNALLMDGWRIVPGTLYATTIEKAGTPDPQCWYRLPDGRSLQPVFCVVVENDEVR